MTSGTFNSRTSSVIAIATTPSLSASIRDLLKVTITFFRISSKIVTGDSKYATIATATIYGARFREHAGADSETSGRYRAHRRIRQRRQFEGTANGRESCQIERRMAQAVGCRAI